MEKSAVKCAVVEQAKAIAPEIAALAYETEQARRPLDQVINKLDAAGLFTILVPERWGGAELDLQTMFDVVEAVSAGCMSTGWITAFNIGHHVLACRFSEQAQAEVFANGPRCLLPATTAALMKATAAPGGWRVSGRAPWGSGIMHADWVLVGAHADDGARVFLIPAREAGIDDVWHMSGMCGTGSNDIVIEDLFVPSHRSEFLTDLLEGTTTGARIHANPIYQMPLLPFTFCEVLGMFSGALRGARDEFVRLKIGRASAAEGRDRSHTHVQIGAACAGALAGEELARGIVRRVQSLLDAGSFSMTDRLELKASSGFAVDHCRRTISDILNRSGAGSFHKQAMLQRVFRDVNMVAIHAYWDFESGYEQLGRHHFGLKPNTPLV